MRTTLELPDAVTRRAKMAAVRRDMSLKDLVVVALEHELDAGIAKPRGGVLDLPLLRSRKPGSRRLSPEDVHDILVREERAAYEAAERH
jgi:hypothetical protein